MKSLDPRILDELLRDVLTRRGVAADAVYHVTASLIETSLRGVDSHGVNLFPHYVAAVDGGRINRSPQFQIAPRKAAVATLDADHGFGHHSGSAAMTLAMEMADKSGMGFVVVKHSTHFGAASYFGLQAARRGYLGLAFTNGDALVRPYGGKERFWGTNPICFTAPIEGEEPLCLDMATSRGSWNQILVRRRGGEAIPSGWAADAQGNPTTDPVDAFMLEPIGDYKGHGLAFMIEILCGVLAGGPIAKDLIPMYNTSLALRRSVSHCFAAISVSGFLDLDIFRRRLQDISHRVRSLEPRGPDPVMMPGDPQKKVFEQRERLGIPIDDDKFNELLGISASFMKALLP